MDVTQLLERATQGDDEARAELLRETYDQLRALATAHMRSERPDHTLTATALVHEAAIQLLKRADLPTAGRGQFFALAARAMRNLLVDHARARGRSKRAGNRRRLDLDEAVLAGEEQSPELVALDEALDRFAQLDPRKSQVVELRYFGGLSIEETAGVLGISTATVKRDWDVARAWLLRQLEPESQRVD